MIRPLMALFLLVHGAVHIGFICSRSWPFDSAEPWVVTRLGAPSATVATMGTALALLTFLAFLVAAVVTLGVFPRAWRSLVVVGSVASGSMLIAFATPWTLPGLAVDVVLLWAVLGRAWSPAPRSVTMSGHPA